MPAPGNVPVGSVTPVMAHGPPWFLRDTYGRSLFRLDHGPNGEDPQLTAVAIREADLPLAIDDAIAWSGGTLMLATSTGLRGYDPSTGQLFRLDLPEPPEPATRLVRDGLGRLWMGGASGLWLAEVGAKAAEAFDRVPIVRRNEVQALAQDPQHADGVIVALGSQGVVFIRARQKP